jgi:PKD repeat protein
MGVTTSGYGQGRTYLGFTTVTTNGSGTGSFSFTLTTPLPAGQAILSATATKLVGTNLTPNDTSQFCRDISIPSVGSITAPVAPVAVNTAISASAPFTDPLTTATQTALWNWGDTTTSAGSVSESGGSGTVTGSHTYAADGVYTVTLTVTNNLGGSAQAVFQYVVVYNPSAGFVTGGGWITSPAGAYPANPALTGPANFGLNARYHSGDTVPSGNTEFQFPAANLNFHATSYDWLVITTNQAQYQGSGTINGAGNYGFFVTALDNGGHGSDLLRLKIWDKNNGNAVVYDTQPGAPTTAAPTTALGGGHIQVHTNAQLVAGSANPVGADPAPLTPAELQPVVREAIARWAAAGISAAQLSALGQVTVGIAQFSGPWLGMAFPAAIWIGRDAAGYGWYTDPSPAADAVFPAATLSAGQERAAAEVARLLVSDGSSPGTAPAAPQDTLATGYTATVHFRSSDGTATLPKNYTFTATDAGLHTFTGLILRKKGKQTLTLTDTLDSALTAANTISVA